MNPGGERLLEKLTIIKQGIRCLVFILIYISELLLIFVISSNVQQLHQNHLVGEEVKVARGRRAEDVDDGGDSQCGDQ